MKKILLITLLILGSVTTAQAFSISDIFSWSKLGGENPILGAFNDGFKSIQLAPSPSNGNCLKTDGTDNLWGSCGSGGSGGGTWSTTTSSVAGQLLNYPNNTTDIVMIGHDSATSSAEYYFDPNIVDAFLTAFRATRSTTTSATTTNLYASGYSVLATTTTSMLNGVIVVDGVHYPQTGAGIRDAVNTCSAMGTSTCGQVFLPTGTYDISDIIQLKSGVSIVGAGIGNTVLVANAGFGSNSVMYYPGASETNQIYDVTIRDIEFDGRLLPDLPYSTLKKAIYIIHGKRVILQNLYAHDFPATCIGPDFLVDSLIDNIIVERCGAPGQNPGHNGLGVGIGESEDEPLVVSNVIARNNENNGVLFEYVSGGQNSHHVKASNIISYGNNRGFRLSGASNVSLTNCSIYDNTNEGVYAQVFGGVNSPSENFQISNCHIHDNGADGVEILTNEETNSGFTITNSHIYNNAHNGVFAGGTTAKFIGNFAYNNGKTGMRFFGNSNGYRDSVTIIGNTSYNNGWLEVSGEQDGFRVDTLSGYGTTTAVVSGNTAYNTSATTSQQYGLTLKNDIADVKVADNQFYNNTSAQTQEVTVVSSANIRYWNNTGIDSSAFTVTDTRDSTISGDLGVGSTSPYAKLTVSNSGTNDSFIVEDSMGDSTPFVINNAGQVAIGDLTPASLLDVGGGGTVSAGIAGRRIVSIADTLDNVVGVQMENLSSGTSADFRLIIKDSGDHYFAFSQPSTGNTGTLFGLTRSTGDFIFNNGGTGRALVLGTIQAQPLVFGTTNLERMRLLSGGNLGIGTTSPYAKLSVVGETVASHFTATTTSVNTFPNLLSTNATSTNFYVSNNASTTNLYLSTGTCSGSNALNVVGGLVTCGAVTGSGSASTTLLADNNTFSGLNTFSSLLSLATFTGTNGTTTNFYTGTASSTNLFASAFNFGSSILSLVGDTITAGARAIIDFGSAISFKLPSNTSPTLNSPGQLAHDTTSENFVATSTAGYSYTFGGATTTLYSFTVASTSADFVNGGIIELPSHWLPQVVTGVICDADAGTSVVVNLSDGTNDTNTVTCTTTETQFAISSNNSFTALEDIRLEVGAITGTVDRLSLRFIGYRQAN